MENDAKTQEQPVQRAYQKIGKHLRATHYKLGIDSKISFIIMFSYF